MTSRFSFEEDLLTIYRVNREVEQLAAQGVSFSDALEHARERLRGRAKALESEENYQED